MYVKHLIKLLATGGWRNIYYTARHQVKAGDSSIYYALERLKKKGVVNENNELTDLGWRLYRLIKATEQHGIRREDCVRRFGLDAVKRGRQLRILSEEKNVVTVTEIKDPPPSEVLLEEMKSAESDFTVSMVHFNKRFAGWFRPWQIMFSLELSWEEKLGLIDKWYREEYWPEIHTILGIGIPLSIVFAPIIVNEVQRRWENAP